MPTEAQTSDILIIGGGPGGISTALHLLRDHPELASRLLVLEKAHYPRPKLCAGGLVADAELILQRLGLDVSEVPHVDASEVHLDFEARGMGLRPRGGHALRIILRDEFDDWLRRKAEERGVQIRQGVTVRQVRPDAEGVTVETDSGSFRARVVVGADGSNGVTRRCVLPEAPLPTARLLEILTPSHANTSHKSAAAYFDFFPVPEGIAGYTWDFPTQVKGTPMRCWGVYDTNLLAGMDRPALKQPLAEEMRRHGFELEQYEIKGHPIRWFDPGARLSVPRVLLVGDAAGSDPLFGEGISIALGYGALAAREIGEAFRLKDFTFEGYKLRIARSSLGRALFTRWLIARVIYTLRWRWFQVLLWHLLRYVVLVVGWLFVVNWAKRLKV
jgi:flavin-dependent dehydrogenase